MLLPSGFPKQRWVHDHIPIQRRVPPVSTHPYRKPCGKGQNRELVKEMLEAGNIQPSSSPYSSMVVLVRKRIGIGGFVWTQCNGIFTYARDVILLTSIKYHL